MADYADFMTMFDTGTAGDSGANYYGTTAQPAVSQIPVDSGTNYQALGQSVANGVRSLADITGAAIKAYSSGRQLQVQAQQAKTAADTQVAIADIQRQQAQLEIAKAKAQTDAAIANVTAGRNVTPAAHAFDLHSPAVLLGVGFLVYKLLFSKG